MWDLFYNTLISVVGADSSFLWADYTCQIVATVAVIFCFLLPVFLVVFAFKFIFNLFR